MGNYFSNDFEKQFNGCLSFLAVFATIGVVATMAGLIYGVYWLLNHVQFIK